MWEQGKMESRSATEVVPESIGADASAWSVEDL